MQTRSSSKHTHANTAGEDPSTSAASITDASKKSAHAALTKGNQSKAQAKKIQSSGAAAPVLAAAHSTKGLKKALAKLPIDTLRKLLEQAAARDPNVMESVIAQRDAQLALEAAKVISFAHYVSEARYELSDHYSDLRGSEQYEMAFNVSSAVEKMFEEICQQVEDHSAFRTKYNAVEAFRQIFLEVLDAGDTLGHEVRKNVDYQWGEYFMEIVGRFTEEELEKLVRTKVQLKKSGGGTSTGTWLDWFKELVKDAKSYGLADKFQTEEALDVFDGPCEGEAE